jgi:hypothetical protein
LVVYRRGDKLVVTRLRIPPLADELQTLFKAIDDQYKRKKKPTVKDIQEEIQAYRTERKMRHGS